MGDEEAKLQETSPQNSPETPRRTRVGFPKVQEEKKGKGKIIFIILAIIALGAVGVWLVVGRGEKEEVEEELSPTAFEEMSTPTPVVERVVDRDEINIQILNGSGISGAAGELEEEFSDLGYSEITVGNASSQNYETTEVIFSTGVDKEVKDEITEKLKNIFEDVDVETGGTEQYDIKVITGYPKGYTPTPTEKPASTSTPTPVATGALTPTSTPTPTP